MIWEENDHANTICDYWNKQCRTRCMWSGCYPDRHLMNFHIRAVPGAYDDLSVTAVRWRPGLTVEEVLEVILLSHAEQMLAGVANDRVYG